MIERQLADFLEEGIGIHIGTRDQRLQPHGARALAVKVDEDGLHLVVYVAEIAAPRLIPNLETNGQVAVSFGRPVDDRACQVKGVFVGRRPATAAERPFVEAQRNSFLEQLERIGIPRASAANWATWPAMAIRLKATAIFQQTPGPQAGAPLQ
jgi:hypothetical protein